MLHRPQSPKQALAHRRARLPSAEPRFLQHLARARVVLRVLEHGLRQALDLQLPQAQDHALVLQLRNRDQALLQARPHRRRGPRQALNLLPTLALALTLPRAHAPSALADLASCGPPTATGLRDESETEIELQAQAW